MAAHGTPCAPRCANSRAQKISCVPLQRWTSGSRDQDPAAVVVGDRVGVDHRSGCSVAFCEDVLEAGYEHAARYDVVVYTDMDPQTMRALLARLGLSG